MIAHSSYLAPKDYVQRLLQVLAICGLCGLAACVNDANPPRPQPVLSQQTSGTDIRFQAVSPVNQSVVWASGVSGTYARTTNGGSTWEISVVPGADSLQFRDVHAVDSSTAYLLSSGAGDLSRIYKTTDGGRTWALQFQNIEPRAFFDCMAFWDSQHGVAFSDAVDGQFIIITTSDGTTWHRVPSQNVPAALPGEGSFAASGTCVTTFGDSTAWIGTGASEIARVLKTTDQGQTWSAWDTPIVSGDASGITSLLFRDDLNGMAAGGEISKPGEYSENVAVTSDGGRTWRLASHPQLPGAIYGIAAVPDAPIFTVVAVGPGGLDYSIDHGSSWVTLDTLDYWSVAFATPESGWAVGPRGKITKIKMF